MYFHVHEFVTTRQSEVENPSLGINECLPHTVDLQQMLLSLHWCTCQWKQSLITALPRMKIYITGFLRFSKSLAKTCKQHKRSSKASCMFTIAITSLHAKQITLNSCTQQNNRLCLRHKKIISEYWQTINQITLSTYSTNVSFLRALQGKNFNQ